MDAAAILTENTALAKIGHVMLSLFFGIAAALSWGVHDVCVGFAAARAGVALAFLTVLAVGVLIVAPVALLWGDWSAVSGATVLLATASGLAYAGGGYSLYRAFAIGPVRLVAPVIGAFPILSLIWAAAQGFPPTVGQALAVLVIVAGVALSAILSGHGPNDGSPTRLWSAFFWSVAAACGFALTFALGQAATQSGAELPVIFISRSSAFLGLAAATLAYGNRPILRPAPWALLAVMGGCDALALGLVQAAGGLAHPEFASVAASVFGMVTILLAWAFLQEKMSAPQWFSVALVFAGIGYLGL